MLDAVSDSDKSSDAVGDSDAARAANAIGDADTGGDSDSVSDSDKVNDSDPCIPPPVGGRVLYPRGASASIRLGYLESESDVLVARAMETQTAV